MSPKARLKIRQRREFVNGWLIVGGERSFFKDLYYSLISVSWPRFFIFLTAVYAALNFVFATLYFIVPGSILNAKPGSFSDLYFFSVHTLATVGYGTMSPANLYANIISSIEAFVGLLASAIMTGLVFAKFSVPKARVMFSKHAVVCRRDGRLSLMFRVANSRGNQVLEARVNVVLVRFDITVEGERVRRLLDLETDRNRSPVFGLSWILSHYLDNPQSALQNFDAKKFEEVRGQIVVTFAGTDNTTGQSINARHVYDYSEVKWNHRLVDIFLTDSEGTDYVDYGKFHDVESVKVG